MKDYSSGLVAHKASAAEAPSGWLPAVGAVVRWISGEAEELLVLAAQAGRVQVRSLLSGIITNTSVEQLMPG